MKWTKYRLATTVQAEDIVAATLAECGIEGVEIVDKVPLTEEEKRQMFVDIAPEPEQDDGSAFLYFYLPAEDDAAAEKTEDSLKKTGTDGSSTEEIDRPREDGKAIFARVQEALAELRRWTDIGSGTIDISETEDVDWINNWKKYFHQFSVDDLVIVPSWEEVSEENKGRTVLHIDPGTAFGTGMHETTQLCIRAIRKFVKNGDRMLDIGTGSGILSIVALKYGAEYAVGTDLDTCTIPAVAENSARNGISEDRHELHIGNLIDDAELQQKVGRKIYDLAAANILAEILIPLMPAAAEALKPGGILILSGILEGKEKGVIAAAEQAGLAAPEITRQGEWVCVTMRCPD